MPFTATWNFGHHIAIGVEPNVGFGASDVIAWWSPHTWRLYVHVLHQSAFVESGHGVVDFGVEKLRPSILLTTYKSERRMLVKELDDVSCWNGW